MKAYIFQNGVIPTGKPLNKNYPVSNKIEDRFKAYIPLSEQQTQFYLTNKNASAMEVWNMELLPPLPPTELRRQAYEKEIPRELIDSFITYTAEGETEKAAQVAEKIATIKRKIKERYPDVLTE